jgi:hypothetical protein
VPSDEHDLFDIAILQEAKNSPISCPGYLDLSSKSRTTYSGVVSLGTRKGQNLVLVKQHIDIKWHSQALLVKDFNNFMYSHTQISS